MEPSVGYIVPDMSSIKIGLADLTKESDFKNELGFTKELGFTNEPGFAKAFAFTKESSSTRESGNAWISQFFGDAPFVTQKLDRNGKGQLLSKAQ